jgi:hypothetical protein
MFYGNFPSIIVKMFCTISFLGNVWNLCLTPLSAIQEPLIIEIPSAVSSGQPHPSSPSKCLTKHVTEEFVKINGVVTDQDPRPRSPTDCV